MKKVLFKHKYKCQIIEICEIIFCKSSSNYSTIHIKAKEPITISKCLTKLSKELGDDFVRISQSYLVNIHHISEIHPGEKQIIISNGNAIDFTIKYSELCKILESKFIVQHELELN